MTAENVRWQTFLRFPITRPERFVQNVVNELEVVQHHYFNHHSFTGHIFKYIQRYLKLNYAVYPEQ